MLDYRELSLNPHHLNRNQQETNIWDLAGIGVGAGMDWYGAQGPSNQALQQSINPLEESYANFRHMAEQYRDPASEMNVQMRDNIRGQNFDAMTDLTRRAANQATGMVDDSVSSKGLSQNAITTAIADALKNYNEGQFKRHQIASDYDAKAGSAAHTLSTARQQNLASQQLMRQQQGQVGTDALQEVHKWGKGFNWGKAGNWISGLFGGG